MAPYRYRAIGSACIALLAVSVVMLNAQRDHALARASIVTHDNREPAGVLRDGVLSIDLVAGRGTWFPERDAGPGHDVFAFGVAGKSLSNPGPLLRVPVGTEIRASIRNTLDAPLVVHGLHDRPGAPTTVTIPASATSQVSFRVNAPGTYLYWGSTQGAPTLRDRWGKDSQLLGALIVGARGTAEADHVFILGVEDDSAALPADRQLLAAAVNGRSWPHSQITTLHVGDTVRTRWINATDRAHPIHLHGFYFRVDARGDIALDTIYHAQQQRLAVTELLNPAQTMTVTWVAERPGNWLMHCHMALHMGPELRLGNRPPAHEMHTRNHTLDVMSGLVTGWRVLPKGPVPVRDDVVNYRKLRLLVQSAPQRFGAYPGIGFALQKGDVAPRADSIVIPGPPLVLTRGEPVQITVVNRLSEPTSIHWHGIELDSYYDGVSGWSGAGNRVAPHVGARDSFVVRFTPPRAGTFIYHSHFDEERQLASGLYGPIVVVEPDAIYDPSTDLTWVLGQDGPGRGPMPVLLNGSSKPLIDLDAGRRYRARLININPNVPLAVTLLADSVPVRWRAVAKDGATLPPAQARVVPASLRIGVGEVYDFELVLEERRELVLRAADPAGVVRLTGRVRVR